MNEKFHFEQTALVVYTTDKEGNIQEISINLIDAPELPTDEMGNSVGDDETVAAYYAADGQKDPERWGAYLWDGLPEHIRVYDT